MGWAVIDSIALHLPAVTRLKILCAIMRDQFCTRVRRHVVDLGSWLISIVYLGAIEEPQMTVKSEDRVSGISDGGRMLGMESKYQHY